MIERTLQHRMEKFRKGFPALLITGPRNSGKTTLARMAVPELEYVNLESPRERALFNEDPQGFLANYPEGAVFDEAQNVPELFNYLQVRIDEEGKMGRWILTGSQQIEMLRSVSQSLAGRVAMLQLHPFSCEELTVAGCRPETLAEAVLHGGYPPLYDKNRDLDPEIWQENYLEAFVRRDVRELLAVHDQAKFDTFVRKVASLTGELLNKSELSDAAGIDNKTVDAWLNVMETCFIIRLLRPHHRNFGKRLSKRPKLHFLDTGLACRLLHLSDVHQLRQSPAWGGLVESWFHSEILKYYFHRGKRPSLWFWRSGDGIEVDMLIEKAGALLPIECKATMTPRPHDLSGIRKLQKLNERDPGVHVEPGLMLHGGEETWTIKNTRLVPWYGIAEAMAEQK